MIQKILLRNFQGHTKKVVELDPSVTTIVGPSDRGKSSIIRGLQWVAKNRPTGDAIIQDGKDACAVAVFVDDHKVSRRKGKGKNEYKIDDEVFKSFGTKVPAEVANLLNMGDINFQGQHDPSFWFSLSPPELSRRLNEIVNLQIMDEAMASVGSQLRKATAVVSVCQDRLASQEVELKRHKDAPRMAKRFASIRKHWLSIEKDKLRVDRLRKALDELHIATARQANLDRLSWAANQLMSQMSLAKKRVEKADAIHTYLDMLDNVEEKVADAKKASEEERKLNKNKCPLCGRG